MRIPWLAAGALALAGCAGVAPRTQPATAPLPASRASSNAYDLAVAHAAERASMVQIASAMLGQPYRWGGASPGGFDCSGLVSYAAGGAGVRVPRTALEQYTESAPVAGDLRQGDLVFMHLARKELHVGIALGHGRFIHAPSSGGRVRIDSLSARPYAQGFIGARSIVPAP